MSHTSVYAPRTITETVARCGNKSLVVRIPYQGYELSIYLETRHDRGDFAYSEMEVIETATQINVTKEVAAALGLGETLEASAENIKQAMGWIDVTLCRNEVPAPAMLIELIEPEVDEAPSTPIRPYGRVVPWDDDPEMQVRVERMDSIPAGDNPFHHDLSSMGTPLVRGWFAMHPGYDANTPETGSQWPIGRMYLVNQRTGNRVKLLIGERF